MPSETRRARQVFRRLRTLNIHDLEEHIKFEVNFTPPSWHKRYNLVKGSTHGLCHNLTQLGYFRPRFPASTLSQPVFHGRQHTTRYRDAQCHDLRTAVGSEDSGGATPLVRGISLTSRVQELFSVFLT